MCNALFTSHFFNFYGYGIYITSLYTSSGLQSPRWSFSIKVCLCWVQVSNVYGQNVLNLPPKKNITSKEKYGGNPVSYSRTASIERALKVFETFEHEIAMQQSNWLWFWHSLILLNHSLLQSSKPLPMSCWILTFNKSLCMHSFFKNIYERCCSLIWTLEKIGVRTEI